MKAYRFRAILDDEEDIYRDVEVKANQSLLELHTGILQAFNFDTFEPASFYNSNDAWEKGKEFVANLKEIPEGKLIMNDAKIGKIIYDPHQKFLFIYDYKVKWTFFVELLKILEEEPKATYPRCVKVVGEAPIQHPNLTPIADEEIEADFDDLFGKKKKKGKENINTDELLMGNAIDDLLSESEDLDDLTNLDLEGEELIADEEETTANTENDDDDVVGFNEDELDGFGDPDDYKDI
jgi:hypothetical protein